MTVLGIAITVFVLIASLALVDGLRKAFTSTGDPLQILALRKGSTSELASAVTPETFSQLQALPGIAEDANGAPLASLEMVTVINLPSPKLARGMNVTLRGLSRVGVDMRGAPLMQGRWFQAGQREVVVGKSISARYPDAAIGHRLNFGRGTWQVVGVMDGGDSALNSEIWGDVNQMSSDYNRQASLSSILVRATDPAAMARFIAAIGEDRSLGLSATSEKEYYAKQTSSGVLLEASGIFIAFIMAVGSSFAAMNTMYAAVARRGREIGTLRTLGFSRFQVMLSFMIESLLLASMAGIVGCIASLPLNYITTGIGNFATFSEIQFRFHVGLTTAIAGITFAMLLGLAGGFVPARAGAKKEILAALTEN
ncbi:ABC transporter permease [Edaphobacter aggregans]|uniref:ABC transporter permease n=1 Tax=Edaphobacter aggregans TaxID=570835 RepID=UPI001FE0760F|nr:ABC transporter permease [Edaphobacter aggregans]